jgi:hypothetical protein
VGDLKTPDTGFSRHPGRFNQAMWYDEKDKNWDKMIGFLKDKKVPVNGKEIPVLEIVGYKN